MMQRAAGESLAAPDAKARLKAHFETLPVQVDSATRAEALARLESVVATPSPNFERMMEAVQAYVRTNVLKDLESAPSASDGFAAWHQEILQQYSAARAKFAGR